MLKLKAHNISQAAFQLKEEGARALQAALLL